MNMKPLAASALLVLVVAACGSSGATSVPNGSRSTAAASAPAGATTGSASADGSAMATNATPVTERDFKFDTPDLAVTGAVALAVTNAGPTVHNLTIRDTSGKVLGATGDLKPAASETLSVDLPAGKYTIFCSLPGHESLGLKGTLTVTK